MSNFKAWPEIPNFHNLRRLINKADDKPDVNYLMKVKLHGTNASVRINSDGSIYAGSRSGIITPEKDNAGFARFVKDHENYFDECAIEDCDIILYGEWCGPGIQKGVAINKLPHRVFATFALLKLQHDTETLYEDPTEIKEFIPFQLNNVKIIPWYNDEEFITINWELSAEELQPTLDKLNQEVYAVGTCDPWAKEEFGVEGVGEGLVLYPQNVPFVDYAFKAKDERHQTVAHTKPAQADATVVDSANKFAELVMTTPRLEQGVKTVDPNMTLDKRFIGAFLKWIAADVEKECMAELESSGLEKKVAIKACSDYARSWYLNWI